MSGTHFGRAFSELLSRTGRTKYRVHKDAGLDQGLVSRLAAGDRLPTPEVMQKLATVFSDQEMAELKQATAHDVLEREGLADALPAEPSPDDVDPEALLRQALFRTADGATVTEGDVEEIVGLWKARVQRKTRNERRET